MPEPVRLEVYRENPSEIRYLKGEHVDRSPPQSEQCQSPEGSLRKAP